MTHVRRTLERLLDHHSPYPGAALDSGNYELVLNPSVVSDRAGNHPTSPITLLFTIRAPRRSW